MAEKISIRQFLANFDAGMYDDPDTMTQINAGWYDWFCKDESLRNKTYKLAAKLKQIVDSPKINQDTMRVWFKNNCPMDGSLYDDFRIADLETGNTIYCIVPSNGHNTDKGMALVYHIPTDKGGKIGYVVEGTWRDVKKYFKEA